MILIKNWWIENLIRNRPNEMVFFHQPDNSIVLTLETQCCNIKNININK